MAEQPRAEATPSAPPDRDRAAQMWAEFRRRHPQASDQLPPVEQFGDHVALSNELIDLVLKGTKRATAALICEFEVAGEAVPEVGDYWIACDGYGVPRVVLQTTEVRRGPVDSVDDQFAWDEGEDDRTRDSWLAGHRRYWRRRCELLGIDYDDSLEALFERFRVVWPPEYADPEPS